MAALLCLSHLKIRITGMLKLAIKSQIFRGKLSVQPLIAGITMDQDKQPLGACQKAVAYVDSEITGSWGGEDIRGVSNFTSRSLENEVILLSVNGLTEGLLMAYIVNLVQPRLLENGETPLMEKVRSEMVKDIISGLISEYIATSPRIKATSHLCALLNIQ